MPSSTSAARIQLRTHESEPGVPRDLRQRGLPAASGRHSRRRDASFARATDDLSGGSALEADPVERHPPQQTPALTGAGSSSEDPTWRTTQTGGAATVNSCPPAPPSPPFGYARQRRAVGRERTPHWVRAALGRGEPQGRRDQDAHPRGAPRRRSRLGRRPGSHDRQEGWSAGARHARVVGRLAPRARDPETTSLKAGSRRGRVGSDRGRADLDLSARLRSSCTKTARQIFRIRCRTDAFRDSVLSCTQQRRARAAPTGACLCWFGKPKACPSEISRRSPM